MTESERSYNGTYSRDRVLGLARLRKAELRGAIINHYTRQGRPSEPGLQNLGRLDLVVYCCENRIQVPGVPG